MQNVSTPPVIGGMLYSDTRFKIGVFSRDTALASGTQVVTGVGFWPKAVIFLSCQNLVGEVSIGFDDATIKAAIAKIGNETNWCYSTAGSIDNTQDVDNVYEGCVSVFSGDGFTITWTRTNAPTGTIFNLFLALR